MSKAAERKKQKEVKLVASGDLPFLTRYFSSCGECGAGISKPNAHALCTLCDRDYEARFDKPINNVRYYDCGNCAAPTPNRYMCSRCHNIASGHIPHDEFFFSNT